MQIDRGIHLTIMVSHASFDVYELTEHGVRVLLHFPKILSWRVLLPLSEINFTRFLRLFQFDLSA